MPTTKPRLAVTLEQEEYDLIKRYADNEGISAANVVLTAVKTILPGLQAAVEMQEVAKELDAKQKAEMTAQIEAISDTINAQIKDLPPELQEALKGLNS